MRQNEIIYLGASLAQVETDKDKYYVTLQALYNTYYTEDVNEKRVSHKKKNRKAGSEYNG